MIYVTRRERFNAAHKLWNSDWSDEKNKNVYGKCANVNWHGHNYDLFVTVKGELQESGGNRRGDDGSQYDIAEKRLWDRDRLNGFVIKGEIDHVDHFISS